MTDVFFCDVFHTCNHQLIAEQITTGAKGARACILEASSATSVALIARSGTANTDVATSEDSRVYRPLSLQIYLNSQNIAMPQRLLRARESLGDRAYSPAILLEALGSPSAHTATTLKSRAGPTFIGNPSASRVHRRRQPPAVNFRMIRSAEDACLNWPVETVRKIEHRPGNR